MYVCRFVDFIRNLSPKFRSIHRGGSVLVQDGCEREPHVQHSEQDVRPKRAHTPNGDVGGAALEVEREAEQAQAVRQGRAGMLL